MNSLEVKAEQKKEINKQGRCSKVYFQKQNGYRQTNWFILQIVTQKPNRQEKNKSKKELVCFTFGIPQIDS